MKKLNVALVTLILMAPGLAFSECDWAVRDLPKRLARGPVEIQCTKIVVEGAGGRDHLKFTLKHEGERVMISDAFMGFESSGGPGEVVWPNRYGCETSREVRVSLPEGAIYGSYCKGTIISGGGGGSTEGGFYIQHAEGNHLFAETFYGSQTPAPSQDIRATLMCRMVN